jgi:hypothetical protein
MLSRHFREKTEESHEPLQPIFCARYEAGFPAYEGEILIDQPSGPVEHKNGVAHSYTKYELG